MSTASSNIRTLRNDVFVSYSHAADGVLAPTLRKALRAYARPWYRMRSLRVYCDETGMMVTPDLWSEISRQLAASDHFVLLASPAAAQSSWVKLELQTWLDRPGARERLFIVLTEGEIAWNVQTRDFDWSRTTALPSSLANVFSEEPRYEDVRPLRRARDLASPSPVLERAVASIHARVRRIPLEDAIGADRSAQRVRLRIVAAAGAALWVTAGVAAYSGHQRSVHARLARTELQIRAAVAASSDAKLLAEGSRRSLPASLELGADALRTLQELGQPAVEAFGVMQKGLRLLPNPALRRAVLPVREGSVRQLAAGSTLEHTALRTDTRVCLLRRDWKGKACIEAPEAPDQRPQGADATRFFWFSDLEHLGLVTARAELSTYDVAGEGLVHVGRFGAEDMTDAKFFASKASLVQWSSERACISRHRGAGRFDAPRCAPLRAIDEIWDLRADCAPESDCVASADRVAGSDHAAGADGVARSDRAHGSQNASAVLVRRRTGAHAEICHHRLLADAGKSELSLIGESCQPSAGRVVGVSEDGSVWVESRGEGQVVVTYGNPPERHVLDLPSVDEAEVDASDRWVVLRTMSAGTDRHEAYLLDLSTRLTRTLQHDGRIAELLPFGRRPYVLSRSGGYQPPDGTVSLWNLSNGAEAERFILDGDVRAMALTSSGQQLLTAAEAEAEGESSTVLEAWPVTPELFRVPEVGEHMIESELYVTAGHSELLVGEHDRVCAFPIDATRPEWCAAVSRPAGTDRQRTLARDASRAYRTIDASGQLCTWMGSGSPLPTCVDPPEGQRLLTLSKHGEYVVTREGAELCVWQSTMLGASVRPSCLETSRESIVRLVSDDGRKLALESDGRGALYDLRTRAPEVDLGVVQDPWERSVLSDDGRVFAIVLGSAATSRSTVRVFAVDGGAELAHFDIPSRVLSLALAPRKGWIAIGTEHERSVVLKAWGAGPETIGTLSTGFPTRALAFDPSETELYTLAGSRSHAEVQRWLVDTRQMLDESNARLGPPAARGSSSPVVPREHPGGAIESSQTVGSL
jgi:WD40 repeat protein